MKAIVYRRHGPPDVLEYAEIDKPIPADGEVLIRGRAASVNPLDVGLMRGVPYAVRLLMRLPSPPTASETLQRGDCCHRNRSRLLVSQRFLLLMARLKKED